ncbi:PREDICTED: aminopeptidase N-like [Priapulus caudatus]|uniref:Aminopeptidase N-like n=1 Tax=Priapulus caudatus TaxID=37621 RepID=A0ABM1EF68_PRICU|nr:PREDICTED: aminopeptidase N-like [Priapulus caudatus]
MDQVNILISTDFLEKETEYITWYFTQSALYYIDLMLSSRDVYAELMAYMRVKVGRFYDSVSGLNMTHRDSDMTILKRSVAVDVACGSNLTQCVDSAESLFTVWATNHTNSIDVNYEQYVSCAAVRHGDSSLAELALQHVTSGSKYRHQMARALGCCLNATVMQRYLSLSLEQAMPLIESMNIFAYASKYHEGRQMAWQYIKDYFYELVSR